MGRQEAPLLVERKIGPFAATATTLAPSAEQATALQLLVGALVWVQVWATPWLSRLLVTNTASKADRTIQRIRAPFLVESRLIFRVLLIELQPLLTTGSSLSQKKIK